VSFTVTVDGRAPCISAARVGPSSDPLTGSPRASWKPRTAFLNTIPSLPSITEVEKPAVLSRTCAWKMVPSISDPGVPGATQGLAVAAAGAAPGAAF
jgi:hypothetical protein